MPAETPASATPRVQAVLANIAKEVQVLAEKYKTEDADSPGTQLYYRTLLYYRCFQRLFREMSVEEYEVYLLLGDEPLVWSQERATMWLMEKSGDATIVI